jgi:hypothetical protein
VFDEDVEFEELEEGGVCDWEGDELRGLFCVRFPEEKTLGGIGGTASTIKIKNRSHMREVNEVTSKRDSNVTDWHIQSSKKNSVSNNLLFLLSSPKKIEVMKREKTIIIKW